MSTVVKWHRRAAALYAIGVWTMIGAYALFVYSGHKDVQEKKKEEEEKEEEVNPNRVVYETAHTRTVVTYKQVDLPLTAYIAGSIRSFFSEPGTGDSDKQPPQQKGLNGLEVQSRQE